MNKNITDILFRLSITPEVRGYEYLGFAVELVCEDKSLLHAVTKELYPQIASQFDTTASAAERNMRHAIERAYDRADSQAFEDVLGTPASHFSGKLTNSAFIGVLAERLRDGR